MFYLAEEHTQRRLVAILAADVVGYSRLMEANEERTLGALKKHRREFFDPTIVKHDGRIFKVMGDGFLVEFNSVLNAARCAVEIQRGMPGRNTGVPDDRHIKFRIGINLGDVIVDGDDFYGDGVNLATRLEGLAGPGGIACSAIVRDQIGDKLDLEFLDQGEQTVRNIARPVRVYIIDFAHTMSAASPRAAPNDVARLRTDKPSVAVLPFTNMSNDPEQEFFSDGITEDIITDLSKVSGLFVLGRNTVFTHKGVAVHLERVAKELGVAFLVEGSVRKAGQKVRINAQLIDGATGGHLWAERYDGDLSDIFALQNEITLKIVDALKVKLLPEESKAIETVPTENVESYTYCLKGRDFLNMHIKRYYRLAREMFAKAVELDSSFATAYAGIADCDSYSVLWQQDQVALASILSNSAKAIELDPNLAEAHASRGLAFWLAEKPEEAETEFEIALGLAPNLYQANYFYGRYLQTTEHHDRAAELFERAAEIRPSDFQALFLLRSEYVLLGRGDAASIVGRRTLERAERELQARPENAAAAIVCACTLASQGETARSKQFLQLAVSAEPDDPRILYNAACAYSMLGEVEPAVDLLEKVVPLLPSAGRVWTERDPDLIPLHSSLRFQALLESISAERELASSV